MIKKRTTACITANKITCFSRLKTGVTGLLKAWGKAGTCHHGRNEQYWGKGVNSECQRRHQNSAYYFPRTGIEARGGIADGDRNALFKFVVGGHYEIGRASCRERV